MIELSKQIDDFVATNQNFRISFLFIDDGSTDETLDILETIKSKIPRCEIVKHKENLGFGPTFKEALTIPKTEYVFFIPADGQFPLANMNKLAPEIVTNDLVLGIRKIRRDSMYRRLNSMVYNRIISLLAGIRIRDVNSIMLYRSRILAGINLSSETAFVNAELVLNAIKCNFRIHQVQIDHLPRRYGAGRGGRLSVVVPTFLDVFKYVFRP
ncbi:MAG: glycosyltransferase family 2 protein [Flavobacteriales bacterium]|nr:glycosyltransferase family 2 protein [Flavobacteriales bacterium]